MADQTLCTVSLCENDDHGNDSGKVRAVNFAEGASFDACPSLELESQYAEDEDLRADLTGNTLIVGHERYRVRAFRSWVGNIYWNGYVISLKDGRRLANQLKDRGWHTDAADDNQPFLHAAFPNEGTPLSVQRDTSEGAR